MALDHTEADPEREALKAGVKDKVVVLEEGVTRFF